MSLPVQYNCPQCKEPDQADNMVACDKCDAWHHFRCAGVNDSIADRSWRCINCRLRTSSVPSNSSRKSMSQAQAELHLKKLDEERAMQAKHLSEEFALKQAKLAQQEEALKLQMALDQRYMEQRYAVLQATLEENDGKSRSTCSQQSSRSKVNDWMEKQQEQITGAKSETNNFPVDTSSFAAIQISSSKTTSAAAEQKSVPVSSTSTSIFDFATSRLVYTGTIPKRPFASIPDALPVIPSPIVTPRIIPTSTSIGATRSTIISQPVFSTGQGLRGCEMYPVSADNAVWNVLPITCTAATNPSTSQAAPFVPERTYIVPTSCSSGNVKTGVTSLLASNTEGNYSVHQSSGGKTLEKILDQINNRIGELMIENRSMRVPNTNMFPPRLRPVTSQNSSINPTSRNEFRWSHSTPHVNHNRMHTPHLGQTQMQISSPILPENDRNMHNSAISSSIGVVVPSQQQLAARQVVSKELPVFSGNPLEWPLFVSSYENSTALCGFSDAENMMRLQRSLRGNALEAVRSNLLMPNAVARVLSTLRMLYGRPELVVNALLEKVRSTPPPKAERLETLIAYGLVVQNLCSQLIASGQIAHLGNPCLLQELVEKLPANIKMDWARYKRKVSFPDLTTFEEYMTSVIEEASEVSLFTETDRGKETKRAFIRDKAFVNAHGIDETAKEKNVQNRKVQDQTKGKCCPICQLFGHKVKDCSKFKSLNLLERWKSVEDQQLCRRCLVRHGKWPCHTSNPCGVNGCDACHHELLHPGKTTVVNKSREIIHPAGKLNSATATSGVLGTHRQMADSILFRVIPVTLYGPKSSLKTFAFLDDGSSLTLMDKGIAKELGLSGEASSLCLNWTGDISRTEPNSERLSVEISGANSQTRYSMSNVRTVEGLKLPTQSLMYEDLVQNYPYLRGLPINSYRNANPRILIGVEHSKLSLTLKKREGRTNEPVATRCRLGWTIHGRLGDDTHSSLFHHNHICDCNTDRELHGMVERFFSTEAVPPVGPVIETEDDKRARRILVETTVRVDGGFETGLLWKYDHIEFPRSYSMAEQRLKCLERRMKADPELHENLVQQIRDYQRKGYAHKASEKELSLADPRRVWYLPLGIVINPKKPNKVRVVWDAAAKVNGISLNTMLLKGPDLLTSLPAVLSRYRQRQIAISADIKEMFHQLRIRESDKHSQRFLWRENPLQIPEVFIMDRATFGSSCSPSSSQYIKNLNAEEYSTEFPEAAEAIINNHYVDDYLDSRDTEDEAIRIAREVKFVHSKGGFEIRNWLSNSDNVIAQLGETTCGNMKRFLFDKSVDESGERILGMIWLPNEDVFTFPILFSDTLNVLLSNSITPTKRQLLKIVMSIFDPMGFLATFLIHGKLIIQELWRAGVEWDQAIPDRSLPFWNRWVSQFSQLPRIRIPRCYFPNYHSESYGNLQMHAFVDASEAAYASAVYFRIEDRGAVRCALVAAKSKVAPLKPQTIPRLELQAATLGCRLAVTVENNHTLQITRRFFWSDSTTVLSWIRCIDPRRYTPFVTFRVSDILSQSNVADWKWVPTAENVADEATKWGKGPNLSSNSRWFVGPEFLYKPETQWPIQGSHAPDTSEELRSRYVSHHVEKRPVVDIRRFSKWERLLRSLAYVHRFLDSCQRKRRGEMGDNSDILLSEQIQKAETSLWRLAQNETFLNEIVVLTNNSKLPPKLQKRLDNTSSLRKLSPFLDESGVIRMEGRIVEAHYVPYEVKFPVILPKDHTVTLLLLDWYHRKYGHGYGETIVNEVKQRFYIPRLRSTVRSIGKKCSWCKIYRASPGVPRMAPLPAARLAAYVKPFTYVGLDYFGPILIRAGRTNQKRWVALFTCLTVRAIHLEVAHSLTTEACKLAVRRFIARRGSPLEIYSDMGTNFVGASKDLQNEVKQIVTGVASTFTNTNTRWLFNPPVSPHMGGAWERMVRAVKMALFAVPMDRKPTDESLITLLAEAEFIVNSRPLTFVPLEAAEKEALTPNHFLLLSSNGISVPSILPIDDKLALRNNWSHVQHMTDVFWKRWIREYLPVITRRTKWFDETRPVKEGELVIVVDDNVRNGWLRGRVVKVLCGPDGRVRMADVQTSTGVLRRPVVKLAVLDVLGVSKTSAH
ncbi:uncharacterized protein LOC131438730 [Malaya genurostris]|uniref:uncharacterized protein LOC131438730 n=1 Tax=Malaya genurostris TaxID=325434 RepID=UPI0026F40228|nr:uncharacterized protein LOC131438730 [Malaya genurostris]